MNEDERHLLASYAPRATRSGYAALLALDEELAGVLQRVREPMVAQMRLTWWHDALSRLDHAPPPAQPVLRDLAAHVVGRGVSGVELATMIEGWEELLKPGALPDAALLRYADGRGATLFRAAAALMGAADEVADAGRGWALADLAAHSREPGRAAALAEPLLTAAAGRRWSRPARALGAMAHLARMPNATPAARTMRAAWHRLTGR